MLVRFDAKLLEIVERGFCWLHIKFGVSEMQCLMTTAVLYWICQFTMTGNVPWIGILFSFVISISLLVSKSVQRPGMRNVNEIQLRPIRHILIVFEGLLSMTDVFLLLVTGELDFLLSLLSGALFLLHYYIVSLTPPPPGTKKGEVWTSIKTMFLKPAVGRVS